MKNPKHCADLSLYRDKSDMTVKDDSASSKIKGKRPGRPSSNISPKQRQERSRQSARECRSRTNVRYQYLEQLVKIKEKSVYKLRKELELHRRWCEEIDNGVISDDLVKSLSIDEQTTLQLPTAEQSDIPIPRQRSLSLPITSNYQTSNLGLTSAQGIPKSTKDSKLYKLLTGRISFKQSHSSEDTANVFHLNRTKSLSSEDTLNMFQPYMTQTFSSEDTSKMLQPYTTQSLSSDDTSNVRHPYTTQVNNAVESYDMFHHPSKLPNTEDTSNIYTQQRNGATIEKLSSTTAPILFKKVSSITALNENQKTATFSSFTKFDIKSQEQVDIINNYKLEMHEQSSCVSDFDNLTVLSNTNITIPNTNRSYDVCSFPKSHSDINMLSERFNADDTSSDMEFVDWILKNQSKLSSDRVLTESARQFGDTAMEDIFTEDQTEITDVSPSQFDVIYSEDNNIDNSNNSNMSFAQTFHGNIKIYDKNAPTTVESFPDNVLPSRTLHYMSTLPNMLNLPTYSSISFCRSTSAHSSQTPSSSMDTLVSQSHSLSGHLNPVDLLVTESKSNVTSILHDVNNQFDQSRTSEDLKELRRHNVSLNNQKPVENASASTSCKLLSSSDNSGFARENNEEATFTSLHHHSGISQAESIGLTICKLNIL
ncbi:unnamed protein product [Mytilus coruscus]|uniref:BZIP domain-containing protein n=1 Tax=Mytilus coruscus TaxID=42192 RepID=A0A6J8DGF1_MYTCO|nr:unnamed protein product [Mytilus coruscus]